MGQFEYKKSLGQNFLKDENIINKIVDSADIDKDTLVIEIGPGQGAISRKIVPRAKYSILYEIDKRLDRYLNDILKENNNYKIIMNDFLKEDVKGELEKYNYDKLYVVANLPYYITTPIVSKLIDDGILPEKIVIMIQKEVAMRYSASVNTKDYGSLTVFLNYYYDIKRLFDVSKNCFIPKPNVDSSVICMVKKNNRLEVKDINLFKMVVKDCFRYKRKTLRNNLKGYDIEKIEKVLSKHNLNLSSRAEEISMEIFVEIVNELA
jgi:16S rRNA (adenine1518-N6/adenine1519-N6)-dimethyltransferase